MLDAFVIEEIKRRERERAREDRPVAELPLPQPPGGEGSSSGDTGDSDRGVVIIDYG